MGCQALQSRGGIYLYDATCTGILFGWNHPLFHLLFLNRLCQGPKSSFWKGNLSSGFVSQSGCPTAEQLASDCRVASCVSSVHSFLHSVPPEAENSSSLFSFRPSRHTEQEGTFHVAPMPPVTTIRCFCNACFCEVVAAFLLPREITWGSFKKTSKPGSYPGESDWMDYSAGRPGHGSLKAPWAILIYSQGWVA